jgi:hypothetical protein
MIRQRIAMLPLWTVAECPGDEHYWPNRLAFFEIPFSEARVGNRLDRAQPTARYEILLSGFRSRNGSMCKV